MAPLLTLLADTARDLMTPGPVSINSTATVAEATAFLTDRGFGAAVVIDSAGHPVGVVTHTDLLIHARERGDSGGPSPVRGVMTEGVFSVQETTPSRSVVSQLVALNVHHLFVVDAAGVVVGVISTLDVLRKLG
jgi:CBS-domain-containing membrane protein